MRQNATASSPGKEYENQCSFTSGVMSHQKGSSCSSTRPQCLRVQLHRLESIHNLLKWPAMHPRLMSAFEVCGLQNRDKCPLWKSRGGRIECRRDGHANCVIKLIDSAGSDLPSSSVASGKLMKPGSLDGRIIGKRFTAYRTRIMTCPDSTVLSRSMVTTR
jgi:hypothetical protein